jgi:hypothetical protein
MPITITPHDLEQVTDRTSLFAFLHRKLGWPLEPEDTFTYEEPLLGGAIPRVHVSRIPPFGASDPFLLLLAEWETPLRRTELREILRNVRARIRAEGAYGGRALDEIVFVCPAEAYQSVLFAHFEEREGRQPRLEVFGWEAARLDATRTLREFNLPALALPALNLLDEPDWANGYKQWLGAWDVEAVTRAFFKDYKEVFNGVRDALPPEFSGDRTLFTQRLFNRLLFIHFLSQKREGWLRFEGRRDYLQALWEGRDPFANFYRSRLRPLFFTALNHRHVRSLREDNPTLHQLIGDVPYLNGGLFEQADDDDAIIEVPDPALEKVLALFGRYRFTITESTPDDVEVAVDPEMLGKVFEELVTGRHESGSYYTPRPVVAFMCREALKGYLGGYPALVDERNADSLTHHEVAALLQKLATVRVVDPACGSGAYLLGMLHELYELTGLLELRADRLSARDQYKRKLAIIQNALYGVDLDPFAVNVARLRLWLSLAVEHTGDVPEPLPNLDFKVEVGDSLASPLSQNDFISDLIRLGQIDDLKAAKDEYGSPDFPGDRKQLDKNITSLKHEIAAWLHQNDKKKDTVADIDKSARIFEWQAEFAEVFKPEQTGIPGGFDIVLANPPYVRQELIKDQKPSLKVAFPEVYAGTADLYCYFYARAVQLLKPGGMLAFISPNKWFRAGYGANLRTYLADTCRVDSITDFGELPVFQAAATFPMIFVAQRESALISNTGGTTFTQVKSLAAPYPDVLALQTRDGHVLPADAVKGADWTLTDSASSDRLRKMEKAGVPLGEYVDGKMYYGLKTGYDKAFLVDGKTKSLLIDADPMCAEVFKPLIYGDTIRKWAIHRPDRWIIFAPWDFALTKYPSIAAHLTQYRDALETRPEVVQGRYKWYCLGRYGSSYHHLLAGPKIVYPEIAMSSRFAFDTLGAYTLKTVFSIPTLDLYLLGVMNSGPAWDYLKQVCSVLGDAEERGRLTLQSIFVSRLPIPNAPDADRAAISALVQKCLDAKGVDCGAWEAEIDARVAALYGL